MSRVAVIGAGPAGLIAALELAERAAELEPDNGAIWNTVGVARLYVGDLEGAIDAFDRDVALVVDADPSTWFSLAMAHHGLGDQDTAREWHAYALAWMATNASDEVMQWFRVEATRVLGVG